MGNREYQLMRIKQKQEQILESEKRKSDHKYM